MPARNEAQTIARVVRVLGGMADDRRGGGDRQCLDRRHRRRGALARGAVVISETRQGMGHAVRTGIGAARHDWVMKVDADLDKFDTALFARMPAARAPARG